MDLVLVIDNYDSFVYNVVDSLARLGARAVVVRNDEITLSGARRMNPDAVIISPGPGHPARERDVGVSHKIIEYMGQDTPILGICLGHQAIGYVYGAEIRRARTIRHGKISMIKHNGDPVYTGLPRVFPAMRYHSLVVDKLPQVLEATAYSTDDGEIMGIRHKRYPIVGVQFHPESIGTRHGLRIIDNFLKHYRQA
ncbi:MAG: aminodeoxychorismate/anthranilate synthase component II [Desulfurococcales archaeon]|nr:aminodeoxychorismate/anthranilate synthase component II [Desulfurococcales archaeon]